MAKQNARNNELEADGTLFMLHAGQRRAPNTWRALKEWRYFADDMAHNRLRERILALKPTK